MIMDVFNLYLIVFPLFGLIGLNKCSEIGELCTCPNNRKYCTCTGLHYIPVLPNTTTILNLDFNYFHHLSRKTFRNVSNIRLRRLILNNNYIERIDCDVFRDLKYLQILKITNEENINITDLKISFKSLTFQPLYYLGLENNKWRWLPPDMFNQLSKAKYLTSISLRSNKFERLNLAIFKPVSSLRKLSCALNSIVYINVSEFSRILYLDLTDNNLYLVPNFCENTNGKFSVPRLKVLILSNNAIRDLNSESFKCLDSLQKLILDGNRMKRLDNNILVQLHSLRELSISHLSHIRIISDYAFNSLSLQILRLSYNNYRFDKRTRYNSTKIFNFLPNLRELDLGKNYLQINDTIILEMLGNLKNLQKLHLGATYRRTIPAGLLQKMPKLEELTIEDNKIRELDASLFVNMTSLKKLDLAANQLHIINETSFPPGFLEGLDMFNMANNPFWCTCDQIWFINLLRTTHITKKMKSWPEFYKCDYPDRLRLMKFSKYNPNNGDCRPFQIVSIVIIIVTSTAMFVFFAVILLLRCQVNIRNAVYFVRAYRRIKQGYVKLDSSEDFEFDAFVVYCDGDRKWVHDVLLNKLENAGLKICVHHRDFDVGEPITSNIEKYMNKSWKVIVVMSNNFSESEWCQWELDLVQERRRQKGKGALVLIMYHQIDSRHMTSPLRTLLHTTPHLTYKEGLGEQLFWKTVTQDINRSLDYPPAALR